MMMCTTSAVDRFWKHVMPEPNSGCWLWTGHVDRGGYAHFMKADHSSDRAHRFSYEAFVGPIVPENEIDHLCRVRCCVNPSHLEQVTPAENTRRGFGPTAMNKRKLFCHRGHALEGSNLKLTKGGRQCQACRQITKKARRLRNLPLPPYQQEPTK